MAHPSDQPASASTGRLIAIAQVREGAESGFAAWQAALNFALMPAPGFRALETLNPQLPLQREWLNVIEFDSEDALSAWIDTPAHAALLEKATPLLQGRLITLRGTASRTVAVPDSVTEVIVTRLVPGQEAPYRAWVGRIQQAFALAPGFQGFNTKRQENGHSWTSLVRFDTDEHLDQWLNSPTRAALLEEAKDFIADVHLHRIEPSFPGWVGVDASGQPPPRWKTTMLVLLSLYPVANLDFFLIAPLVPKLPLGLAYFLPYCVGVIIISYLLMPFFVRVFSPWLYATRPANRKKDALGSAIIVALYAVEIVIIYWIFHRSP